MKQGKVALGWVTDGIPREEFLTSLLLLKDHDRGRRWPGSRIAMRSSANISKGRNEVVRRFLADYDEEWLWMLDNDIGFPPTTLEQLLEAADAKERPIVSGLYYAQADDRPFPRSIPLMYRPDATRVLQPIYEFTPGEVREAWGTGAGCLLMHRHALERIAGYVAEHEPHYRSFPWFFERTVLQDPDDPSRDEWLSEDVTLCVNAHNAGLKVFVHTGVSLHHYKTVPLNHETYAAMPRHPSTPARPTFVVIPVRDELELTAGLLADLAGQGGAERVLVYDNGSTDGTGEYLARVRAGGLVEPHEAAGLNIHEMWNAGIDRALELADGRPCHVAILNNDLRLGPAFLGGLSHALMSTDEVVAVGPNFDPLIEFGDASMLGVEGVDTKRYDGTPGLPGFAFMVESEFLDGTLYRYRFPAADASWWYGDNDLVYTIRDHGLWPGIVRDVRVEHLAGGAQTARHHDLAERIERDREWFERRWGAWLEERRRRAELERGEEIPVPS